jgi:hypothetical protein
LPPDELDLANAGELATINRQVGALLRVLHDVRFEAFGYVDGTGVVSPHETNLGYMRFHFAKKLREFETFGGDLALVSAIERHVAAHEELLAGVRAARLLPQRLPLWQRLVPRTGGLHVSGLLDFGSRRPSSRRSCARWPDRPRPAPEGDGPLFSGSRRRLTLLESRSAWPLPPSLPCASGRRGRRGRGSRSP